MGNYGPSEIIIMPSVSISGKGICHKQGVVCAAARAQLQRAGERKNNGGVSHHVCRAGWYRDRASVPTVIDSDPSVITRSSCTSVTDCQPDDHADASNPNAVLVVVVLVVVLVVLVVLSLL